MRLADLVDGFYLMRGDLAATTRENYRYCTDQLLDVMGRDKEVQSITETDLRGFTDWLRQRGLSERSIADKLAICSSLFSFAQQELGIANVVQKVQKPKWKPKPVDPFSEDEVKALVKAAEWAAPWVGRAGKPTRSKRPTAIRDVAIILILVDTGIRASELCALEWRDYDANENRLHIRHGKGDKARFVYLGVASSRALWRYKIERGSQSAAVTIFATRFGQDMERTNLRHMLERVGVNARIADVHPHRFRHTFAITFLRNGGNVFELQRILGHEGLETVRTYLSLAQTDIATAQRKASPADNWRL